MKVDLTAKFVERAKAGEYFDAVATGLSLRVGKNRRTWIRHTTAADGRRGRETIGHFPSMTLATARRIAIDGPPKATTFKAVAEEWLMREAGMTRDADGVASFEGGSIRRPEERLSAFERLVYPALGDRPIEEIKRSEITAVLDEIADNNGPVMADRTLAYVRKVMNWHAARSDDWRPPFVAGMARTKPSETAGERTLTDAEIKAIWNADTSGSLATFHRYVKFLLLTAVRRTEASKGHKRELKDGLWTIPAERMKGKLDFVVPFSAPAAELVGKGAFWFSTDNGTTPISGFSKFKAAFDEAVPLAPWTLHDLRRTARSLMSAAGVAPDIGERCIAHKIGGVRGVYDRYAYLAEKRDALSKLAGLVGEITT